MPLEVADHLGALALGDGHRLSDIERIEEAAVDPEKFTGDRSCDAYLVSWKVGSSKKSPEKSSAMSKSRLSTTFCQSQMLRRSCVVVMPISFQLAVSRSAPA